jgi:hypothetical protein
VSQRLSCAARRQDRYKVTPAIGYLTVAGALSPASYAVVEDIMRHCCGNRERDVPTDI